MESVFVITGATRGLGLALAQAAVRQGATVIGIGRDPRPDSLPLNVGYSQLDCSDAPRVVEFFQDVRAKFGGELDLTLINNAGTFFRGDLAETDYETVEQILADNYSAAVCMTMGFLKFFDSGTIVNLNSFAGLNPRPGLAAYGAAKAAQKSFFASLRQELASSEIRITNLYPRRINTWSETREPNTIDKGEAASWILQVAQLKGSFVVTDCTMLPADGP